MKDWLKLKKYVHFSPPLQPSQKPFIRSYVSNPRNINRHRFYPFIHFTIVEKRFRRKVTSSGEREKHRTPKVKKREIFYANHLDAQVYSYYAFLMNQELERIYQGNQQLNDSVIAYRAIEYNKRRNKCNIDFAKEVFDFITKSEELELVVICFDIKSFFDTIDHNLLKKDWANLLERNNLPRDHYQVFKAITRFSYVEIGDLIEEFDELKIKRFQYLRNKNVSSFCKSEEEFRRRVVEKGLINHNRYDFRKRKTRTMGIPQGSPISAVLSNLYLLDLDRRMVNLAKNYDGLYRRYSDDLLFICTPKMVTGVKNFLKSHIQNDLLLQIQDKKTQEVHFRRDSLSDDWTVHTIENQVRKDKPLCYLGFEFDGKKVYLRQKGLSRYYRSIKRLIRRKANYANYAKKKNERIPKKELDDWIYRERIYKTKTHLGAKRKKVDGKVFWGNFISYVRTASKVMNQPSLNRQVRNHWKIVEGLIKELEEQYRLTKSPSKRFKARKKRKTSIESS